MKICEANQCYGCFSCINTCPVHCITMNTGINGHIVPTVDESKCIHCGRCKKVCPALNTLDLHDPLHTYAAWNLDKKEQEKSSSGGIAALLAKHVIQNKGVVYGAAFDDEWNVNHVRCETEEDIRALCKSKYVHSWINDKYKMVQNDLIQGKTVLFIGTPCQIAGLRAFLQKDQERLLTVDLVCHGVPSRMLYREELEEKANVKELKNITFRGDYGYGYGMGFGFYYENGMDSFPLRQSYYIKGFMDGLFYRESCYQCPFASRKRIGDLTLGDFWGIGKNTPFYNPEGNRVSLVLVNTLSGQSLLSEILKDIFLEERTIEEAATENAQLRHPTPKPKNYESFKKLYKKYGLKKAAQRVYPKMRIRLILEKLRLIKITR